MKSLFIPLDYDYFDWQGKNYVRIIGRNDKGKRLCVIDEFEPYLWAVLKDNVSQKSIQKLVSKIEKIKIKSNSRITTVKKVEVKDKKFLGKDVKALKIFITNYKDGHDVADKLDYPEIECRRGYDVNLITKYIIDNNLKPLEWYEIDGEYLNGKDDFGGISNIEVDECYKLDKVSECKKKGLEFTPRVLAFDIEADEFQIGKGEVLMVSLVGRNFKKVLTWKKSHSKNKFVECFKDEADMLEAFVNYVKEYDADVLVGYFSDGFDMPYLRKRAEKNKVRLSLGVDGRQPVFARGRIPSAKVHGIVHVDIFRFIESVYSQYLTSETLGLDDVSSELLGEKKTDFDVFEAVTSKSKDWEKFFEYNLQDSVLTHKLFEKLWHDIQEFSKVIQEPLFDVTRSSMSQHVENYILHNLDKYDEVEEKRPLHDEIGERKQREKYEGAFVFQPKAGLYENICIFDFTSMYGSVIVSHNLSKSTLLKKKEKGSLEVDIGKKVYFSKKPGFFPEMLGKVIKKRKEYKQEYKKNPSPITKARSNAYKLLTNAAYGYLGFFGARYYCVEAAASTAALARKHIKDSIDKINKEGFETIYSDTDSIAFLLNGKSKKQTLDFLKKLNSKLPGIMELDLEGFYKRGIWVTKRSGDFGAKKKYALIDSEGKLKIRGFETIRRDWCRLARETQNKVLQFVLEDGDEKRALDFLNEVIKKVKERDVEKKDIFIRTQLKKPLEEYKAVTPHVVAAQKLKDSGKGVEIGMLIEYYIAETKSKKKLVREKVKLPDEKGEYNIKYYLERQILPAVENIIEVFNIDGKEIIDGKKQSKLFEF